MIYLTLFFEFFKIGLFSFGGGLSMIPLIRDAVLNYGWLTESEFYNFVGVCESTPGPIAVNMATYVGSQQAGLLGSISATLGVIMPSFIIILLIASILKSFTKNKYFQGFMYGVRPVVVALILTSGTLLLIKAIGFVKIGEFNFDLTSLIVFCLIAAIYYVSKYAFHKKIPTVAVIILSACLGIGVSLIRENLF